MIEFSVLMSLYIKENPLYLESCLESLSRQTLQPNEIVMVLDGPISQELNDVLLRWNNLLPLKIYPITNNVGLGKALNYGLEKCAYNIIARMDTDDICHCKRFEWQISEFVNEPKLVLLGGAISEFEDNVENITGTRKVPQGHKDILLSARMRNPFNHMTVMYKRNVIQEVGGYIHHHFMEDYNLWLRVLSGDHLTKNLSETLVYARVGNAMLSRRRGMHYIKSEYQLAILKHQLGFTGKSQTIYIFLARCLPRIIPFFIIKRIYKFLRK